jgi:hypothetical protein
MVNTIISASTTTIAIEMQELNYGQEIHNLPIGFNMLKKLIRAATPMKSMKINSSMKKQQSTLALTGNISLDKNGFTNTLLPIKKDSTVINLTIDPSTVFDTTSVNCLLSLANGKANLFPKGNFPYGKNQIKLTEWGPYNFQYPPLLISEKN